MHTYPSDIQTLVDEFLPIFRELAVGRYAVSIGGSYGKGNVDQYSDIDFRLFCEDVLQQPEESARLMEQMESAIQRWEAKGYTIDGCWIRTIAEVNEKLDRWTDGIIEPVDRVWTIWGYHILTDIYNQAVIEDPFDVLADWRGRLDTYPPKLKRALLDKHLRSVRYWRDDYHYLHKVRRADRVFLAGITSKIVHDLIKILFALNETYYVGDGNNLEAVSQFKHLPDGFVERVERVLYPTHEADTLERQRNSLIALIDEVEALVENLVGVNESGV